MKRKLKASFALSCLAILLFVLFLEPAGGIAQESENLLLNGSFEITDENGLPKNWYTDAYVQDAGYTVFSTCEGINGTGAVQITNNGLNDARFAQTVSVEPDTLYCLSGYIFAESVDAGRGANLSIEGVFAFSDSIYETDGEWQYIEYYGETGPDQHSITVFARLGGYSGESTGKAAFDQLTLREVHEVPGDLVADRWFTIQYEDSDDDYADVDSEEAPQPGWPFTVLIGMFYAAAFLIAARFICKNEKQLYESVYSTVKAVSILFCAFVLRIIISYFVTGYQVDVNCFLSWGYTFSRTGPGSFYQSTSFCDYPPLYTYILGLNSSIANMTHASEGMTRVIFRFFPACCDIASCCCIYRLMISDCKVPKKEALVVLLFAAFNPATVLNTAAWGQMDSVLCLLILLTAVYARKGKWLTALPIYVISVLVKPQALMLGPLGLVYLIAVFIRRKEERRKILLAVPISLGVLLLGVVPFFTDQTWVKWLILLTTGIPVFSAENWTWIFSLYGNTLSSYPYATVNTANLYYILGGNWSGVFTGSGFVAPAILSQLSLGYSLLWFFKAKSYGKSRFAECAAGILFSVLFIVLLCCGASWAWIGGSAMALSFVIVMSLAVRKGNIHDLAFLGALLFILLYVFGVKMHERYLFPSLILLAAAWAEKRDKRILYLMALFTTTLFVNEGIVLDNSIRLGSSLGHLNSDTVWLADILSVSNVLAALFAVYTAVDIHFGNIKRSFRSFSPIFPIRKEKANAPFDWKPDSKLHWNKKDTIWLSAITVIFSVISLTTLGSTKAPQTSWKSSSPEEQVVFDLGSSYNDISVLYFAQVSRYDFTVESSEDGVSWVDEVYAQMDQGQCWKWKYVTLSYENADGERKYYGTSQSSIVRFSGRYIRITAGQIGLTLNEVIFRNGDGKTITPVQITRFNGNQESELYSDPAALSDEQDTLEDQPDFFGFVQASSNENAAQPGWWNSTYFDEIYHARTGYEFLQGTVPYETSHPPLGKIMMSVSIAIFGMTPFGWRFAGAIAGILMLPGMYLLAKQMTKKTGAAVIACLLMALDCMHLTQSQIATIDSFPVLFIMFAYYFMLRFMQRDIIREKLSRVLPDLGLCGLFMGLSIASKWIGIYAGAGLAVLFAWHCLKHIRICRSAEKAAGNANISADEKDRLEPYLRKTGSMRPDLKRILILCAWCVLFFIAVPLIVYLLSYIPYMAYNSKRIKTIWDYFSEVWRAQIGMLNYHSTPGLGMDHPFYSPWWEWPVIGKPMYYAAEQFAPAEQTLHSSIFCIGNPVVWFGGLAGVLVCLARWILGKRYISDRNDSSWHLYSDSRDNHYAFLLIGLLAQYLPWVLVPRGTYIYHYFASLPFLMLLLSLCFHSGSSSRKARLIFSIAGCLLLVITLAAFILFFPYASGLNAPESWLDIGRKLLRIWY